MRAAGRLLPIPLFSYGAQFPFAESYGLAVDATRYSIIFRLIETNLIENEA
jgi:hypothetical protein